jgi:hypothetical protein
MVFGGNVRNRPPACCVAYQGGLNDSPRPSPLCGPRIGRISILAASPTGVVVLRETEKAKS